MPISSKFDLGKPILKRLDVALQLSMVNTSICTLFPLPQTMEAGLTPETEIKKQQTKPFLSTFVDPTSEMWKMTNISRPMSYSGY